LIGGNSFDECKYVCFTLQTRTKSLSLGPYTPYQNELFERICNLRDVRALTYAAISIELTALGYASPRACPLQAEHVFSIYRKGKQRKQRLNAEARFSLVDSDQ